MAESVSLCRYKQSLNYLAELHKSYKNPNISNFESAIKAIETLSQNHIDNINKFYKIPVVGSFMKWCDGNEVLTNIAKDRLEISEHKNINKDSYIRTIEEYINSGIFTSISFYLKGLIGEEAPAVKYTTLISNVEKVLRGIEKRPYAELIALDSQLATSLDHLGIQEGKVLNCLRQINHSYRNKFNEFIHSIAIEKSLEHLKFGDILVTQEFKIGKLPIKGDLRPGVIDYINQAAEKINEIKQLPRLTMAEKGQYVTEIKRWEKKLKESSPLNLANVDVENFNNQLIQQLSPRLDAEADLGDVIENSILEVKEDISKISSKMVAQLFKRNCANLAYEKQIDLTVSGPKKREIQKNIDQNHRNDGTGILKKLSQMRKDISQAAEYYSHDLNLMLPWQITELEKSKAMKAEGIDHPISDEQLLQEHQNCVNELEKAARNDPFLDMLLKAYRKMGQVFVPEFNALDQFKNLLDQALELGVIDGMQANDYVQMGMTKNGFKMDLEIVKHLKILIQKASQK